MKKWLLAALLIPRLVVGDEIDTPRELEPESSGEVQSDNNSTSNQDANPCNSTICNFETEPSALVGSVNVITGDYLEFSTDIVIPGPEPLALQRSYCSSDVTEGNLTLGWNHNLFGYFHPEDCEKISSHRHKEGDLIGPCGSKLMLKRTDRIKDDIIYQMNPEMFEKGLTNCGQGQIGARTNRKNMSIACKKRGYDSLLKTGSGAVSFYARRNMKTDKRGHFLRWERKPNGNKIKYYYDEDNHVNRVEACNKKGDIMSWLEITYPKKQKKHYEKNAKIEVTASDGRKFYYKVSPTESLEGDEILQLLKVVNPNEPAIAYESEMEAREEIKDHIMINKKIMPEGRYLETLYYAQRKKEEVGESVLDLKKHDKRFNRVKEQKAPLGENGEAITMRRFFYYFDKSKRNKVSEGHTDVRDAYNHKVTYHYCEESRLNKIKWYSGTSNKDRAPYKTEYFTWGEKDTSNEGNLLARGVANADGKWIAAKAYKYDKKGNILKESLYGNLSGEGEEFVELTQAYPSKSTSGEHCSVKYAYTDDDFNLLIEERHPDNKVVAYEYYEKSDLLKSKYLKVGNEIKLREFYQYNKDAVMVQKIVDDGTSQSSDDLRNVTQRNITYIAPRTQSPCRGLPSEITEKYLDMATGQEVQLKRTKQEYDNFGHMTTQYHFDANDQQVFQLSWKYDQKGNPIEETDALGNVIEKRYDANNNLIYKKGANPDSHTVYAYDLVNRLIREEFVQEDGTKYATSYQYDYLGNKIASVDYLGNKTEFVYDGFSRVIEKKCSKVLDPEGNIHRPKFKYEYDLMGNCSAEIDSNGNVIRKKYNIRGQVTEVIYPDQSIEKNLYNLIGNLKKHTSKNGVYTLYTYDALKRPVKKEVFEPNGILISSTSSHYDALHLVSDCDETGIYTYYKYDGAGRLVETKREGLKSTKHYDDCGNLAEERQWLSETEYTTRIKTYNIIGKVLEERIEDQNHQVFYKRSFEYDQEGNCVGEIEERHQGGALTRSQFDCLQRPISIIDPLGNTIRMDYKIVQNEIGQNVLEIVTTDPLFNQQVQTHDALGRVVRDQQRNVKGEVIQQRTFTYDLLGNLVRTEDLSLPSGDTNYNLRTYDSCNRLISLIQAYNTPEQKETKWAFNIYGQKESMLKPDGVKMSYGYDLLGLLKTVKSSDGTIDYAYSYDISGLPVEVIDNVHSTTTRKVYDASGRLINDHCSNGLSTEYSYDAIGRVLTIEQQGIKVVYTYEGPNTKMVERQTSNGEVLYRHIYDEYDLSGTPLSATLAKDKGHIIYQYDKLGRLIDQTSPYYSQNNICYDAIGNLIFSTTQDALGVIENAYRYNELYQLTDEAGVETHHYNFDSLYNRIEKDDDEFKYNALNQIAESDITYDKNGNVIQKGEMFFEYDAWDRLIHVTTQDTEAYYTYDELNRRTSKTLKSSSGNTYERYIYQDMKEVGHVNEDGNVVAYRVLGVGKGAEIGASIAIELNGEVHIPIHDNNGNIVALSNGEVYRYTSFGEQIGSDVKTSPWRYASKRFDEETQFTYFGRRYYDAQQGRWLTQDPTGEADSPNLYAYVLNSPLTNFDLYGLFMQTSSGQIPIISPLCTIGAGLIYGAGSLIHDIGFNLVPIPLVRDAVSFTGWCMMRQNPKDYTMSYRQPHSEVVVYNEEGKVVDSKRGVLHAMLNGILNTRDEAAERGRLRAIELGQNVCTIINPSHGFIFDIMDAGLNFAGIETNSARVARGALDEMTSSAASGKEITVDAHSKGGVIMYNLRDKLMAAGSINVDTYGSPVAIPQGYYGGVRNYVSTRDGVALLFNPIQNSMRILGYSHPHVILAESDETPLFDHRWEGPTYSKIMRLTAQERI